MRHLLICPEYPPAAGGGIGTYAHNLVSELASRGETVHVVAASAEGSTAEDTESSGLLTVHRLRGGESFATEVANLLVDLIPKVGIDLIETQEYDAPLWTYLQRNPDPAKRPPVLLHFHSPTELIALHNGPAHCRRNVGETIQREKDCVEAAQAFLSPSRRLADWAIERYGLDEKRMTVTPYPLGSLPLLERTREVWETGPILFMGRLEPRKGAAEWIEAAVERAQTDPALRFSFAGRNVLGPNRFSSLRELHDRIPFRYTRAFHFHGHVSRSRLKILIASARAAVVPSRWDNLPHTCLEAMASGLPVITTNQGGMSEVVEDGVNGWISSESDPDSLGKALDRMRRTSVSDLEAMGREASRRVRGFCDNTSILVQHLQTRQRVVEVHRQGRDDGQVFSSTTASTTSELPALPSKTERVARLLADTPKAVLWKLKTGLS